MYMICIRIFVYAYLFLVWCQAYINVSWLVLTLLYVLLPLLRFALHAIFEYYELIPFADRQYGHLFDYSFLYRIYVDFCNHQFYIPWYNNSMCCRSLSSLSSYEVVYVASLAICMCCCKFLDQARMCSIDASLSNLSE